MKRKHRPRDKLMSGKKKRTLRQLQEQMKLGFRSGLEEKVALELARQGFRFEYETVTLPWQQPAVMRKYTPDFVLTREDGSQLIIETKGRFVIEDRKKMQQIKKQYPNLDIRFVFSNSNEKLRKGAKTSYGEWCEKNGFLYADKTIPREWLKGVINDG